MDGLLCNFQVSCWGKGVMCSLKRDGWAALEGGRKVYSLRGCYSRLLWRGWSHGWFLHGFTLLGMQGWDEVWQCNRREQDLLVMWLMIGLKKWVGSKFTPRGQSRGEAWTLIPPTETVVWDGWWPRGGMGMNRRRPSPEPRCRAMCHSTSSCMFMCK